MDDQATETIATAVRRALPGRRLTGIRAWPGGRTNRIYRLAFRDHPDAALRLYAGGRDAVRKDVDLHAVLAGRVPVPAVLAARPDAAPAFAVFTWVDGPLLREIRAAGDPEALAAAGRSLGATLARLVDFRPAQPPPPFAVEELLAAADVAERAGELDRAPAQAVRDYVRARSADLDACDADAVLVHGDVSSRNVIVADAVRPAVAALIDWERSRIGSALIDLGSALRYERPGRPGLEPHLSDAYREAGGRLPADWRDLARLYDLIDVLRGLGRAELPADARAELRAIVAATVTPR